MHRERGEFVVVLETIVVAMIILAFLVAIKYSSNSSPSSSKDYYPREASIAAAPQGAGASSTTRRWTVDNTPSPAEISPFKIRAASTAYIIDYHEDGFWPSLVDIKASSTSRLIIFRNVGPRQMWVRGDPAYYGGPNLFDQGAFVERGGVYTVTLPPGPATYTYRNYLNYPDKGIIRVR